MKLIILLVLMVVVVGCDVLDDKKDDMVIASYGRGHQEIDTINVDSLLCELKQKVKWTEDLLMSKYVTSADTVGWVEKDWSHSCDDSLCYKDRTHRGIDKWEWENWHRGRNPDVKIEWYKSHPDDTSCMKDWEPQLKEYASYKIDWLFDNFDKIRAIVEDTL